ncbi:branched-chain amino acid aminotransferase [Pikeienuella sp. HZG-20]|uniref:branched-chain amino acid aminotransferase n=1 Tax=Paludibacillus litoralis TaxID=3133267 RepID=UPI0030EB929B
MSGQRIWTYFEGEWREGNTAILGAADHGAWLGSMVFDGARAFDGMTPDLALHMARVNDSARRMGLAPPLTDEEVLGLAREGVAKFPAGTGIYIRPMLWARKGASFMVAPDPESTAFALCLEEMPMPEPTGISLCATRFRRPTPDCMPVDAKAACLYPNNARMLREAVSRGFQNAIVADAIGNISETATSNIFMARDGVVMTPVPSGCFLNGITRQRVISLLREDGVEVRELSLRMEDFMAADEIFTTGNALKVMHATRLEDRDLRYGPLSRRARELYWDFAASAA